MTQKSGYKKTGYKNHPETTSTTPVNVLRNPDGTALGIIGDKCSSQNETEVVKEYLQYPLLPTGKVGYITRIGQFHGQIHYGTFRNILPQEFPKCTNPKLEYEDEEVVQPMVIWFRPQQEEHAVQYRVPQISWFPIHDVYKAILSKQARTGKKVLPVRVTLDPQKQWMIPLMNASFVTNGREAMQQLRDDWAVECNRCGHIATSTQRWCNVCSQVCYCSERCYKKDKMAHAKHCNPQFKTLPRIQGEAYTGPKSTPLHHRKAHTQRIRELVAEQLGIQDMQKLPAFCHICGDLDDIVQCAGTLMCRDCCHIQQDVM